MAEENKKIEPGATVARKAIDEQVEQTRAQVPKDSKQAEADVNARRKTLKEYTKNDPEYRSFLNVAEKDYKDRIQKADDSEFKEKMVHALGQFTAGLSGLASLQNKNSMGINTGGIKFTPSDFKAKRDRIYQEYKDARQQAEREHQQRIAAASADVGASERQADRLYRQEQDIKAGARADRQFAETVRGRKASEDASRMQRMQGIREFGERMDLSQKQLELQRDKLIADKASDAEKEKNKNLLAQEKKKNDAFKRLASLSSAGKIDKVEAFPIVRKDLKLLGIPEKDLKEWDAENSEDKLFRDDNSLQEMIADGLRRVQAAEDATEPVVEQKRYDVRNPKTGKISTGVLEENLEEAKKRGGIVIGPTKG